jgi:predicted Zn-dependent protease
LVKLWSLRVAAAATAFAVGTTAMVSHASAQSLIRDAEIEHTIRSYTTPLFGAAGLDPDALKIYLLNDRVLNSFVTGGQNIFITTGLLMRAESANQIIGVLAHETGHIAGGHLARMADELRYVSREALAAQILGLLIAAASGNGGAAAAVGMGGMQIAERSFLSYSRTQEASADQAALNFLTATHQSAKGLSEFFDILGDQEALAVGRQDPYVQTHPLTRDRAAFVSNFVAHSPLANTPEPPRFDDEYRRMRAKLFGFIEPLDRVLKEYKPDDNSNYARYARAVAYYRVSQLDKALPLIDGLLAEEPKNPYYYELKGQMLFENGRVKEALGPYEEMVRLAPNEPLLRTSLAHVQIELNDPKLVKPALANLIASINADDTNPVAWRLAATAYGLDNQMGMSSLSGAEYNLRIGRLVDAKGQAQRASRLLPRGSPGWLRAQDIENETKNIREQRDRER